MLLRTGVTAAALALLCVVAACDVDEPVATDNTVETQPAAPAPDTTSPTTPSAAPEQGESEEQEPSVGPVSDDEHEKPGEALVALATLKVKGRAAKTGYDRAMFGQAWLDTDRNGCDTRNDILAAQLSAIVLEANGCVVTAGVLDDPYTGLRIDFVRGHGALVDIDHVVSLSNAWVTGAASWSMQQRAAFANDPLNLLAVDAGANRQKSDGDAATWLPANKGYRCEFVARQVAVKHKYGLWATPPEVAAIERILHTCPGQPLADDSTSHPTVTDHRVPEPVRAAPKPKPTPRTPAPVAPPVNVHYKNCTAAREAGAAPVHVGDPGYGRHLDRDGDGIGCE